MSELADQTQLQAEAGAQAARAVFLFLHGSYGAAFLSKWATGEKDPHGKDRGVRSAMMVWQAELARFAPGVVEAAVRRAAAASPSFPPNLPEVVAACEAAQPRKTYAEESPRLPKPEADPQRLQRELDKLANVSTYSNDPKDWARRILQRQASGERVPAINLRFAREALGIHAGA